jgi:hypothetical protein
MYTYQDVQQVEGGLGGVKQVGQGCCSRPCGPSCCCSYRCNLLHQGGGQSAQVDATSCCCCCCCCSPAAALPCGGRSFQTTGTTHSSTDTCIGVYGTTHGLCSLCHRGYSCRYWRLGSRSGWWSLIAGLFRSWSGIAVRRGRGRGIPLRACMRVCVCMCVCVRARA